ncbi:hypothetical protein [Chlamydia felis]|uniref:hypothetical protein n=1 Tax=Chlamydia felis TaxID=83556 RepID=UPI0003041CBF|nr:hypothetical protein [Chlamydia felis]
MLSPVDTQELPEATTDSSLSTQTAPAPSPQQPPKLLSGSLVIYPYEENTPPILRQAHAYCFSLSPSLLF